MIVQVVRGCVLTLKNFAIGSDARHRERLVAVQPLIFKLQIVIDQNGMRVSVIADPITMDPRIYKREGQQKENEERSRIREGKYATAT